MILRVLAVLSSENILIADLYCSLGSHGRTPQYTLPNVAAQNEANDQLDKEKTKPLLYFNMGLVTWEIVSNDQQNFLASHYTGGITHVANAGRFIWYFGDEQMLLILVTHYVAIIYTVTNQCLVILPF